VIGDTVVASNKTAALGNAVRREDGADEDSESEAESSNSESEEEHADKNVEVVLSMEEHRAVERLDSFLEFDTSFRVDNIG
jgi:hypothetical protein